MRSFVNARFLVLSLLTVLVVGGGFYAWWWYSNRPDTLFTSAQQYYQEAEEARKLDDKPRAKKLYESADGKLQTLLSEKKAPGHIPGWMLRAKVLTPLSNLLLADERERALRVAGESFLCAKTVADRDPTQFEAQAIMIDHYLRPAIDEPDRAEGYARTLLANLPPTRPEIDKWENYVAAAYFLLGRASLRPETRKPDDALAHVRSAETWERETAKREPAAANAVPRWRTIDVEAKALYMKSELDPKNRPGGRPVVGGPLAQLKDLMPAWIERARRELQETSVPASGDKPPQAVLPNLSPTNARGILGVLALGVTLAGDKPTVQDRADLLLQVCETMAQSRDVNPHIPREAARYANLVPGILATMPLTKVPDAKVVDGLHDRVVKVSETALEKAAIDPSTYLQMSQNHRREGDLARATKYAAKGLEVAAKQNMSANSGIAVALHMELGWLLLLQKKAPEAEAHLKELERVSTKLSPLVTYMQGIAAVLDGRLEEGVQKLLPQLPTTKNPDQLVPLQMALSYAYMGQGKYELALPLLEKIQAWYVKTHQPGEEERAFRQIFLQDITAVVLDMYRCNLALSSRVELSAAQRKAHFEQSERLRAELAKTTQGPTADSLLINTLVAQAKGVANTQPEQATLILQSANQVYNATAQANRDDPRLVWTKVNLLLSQATVNAPVMASAAFGLVGAQSDIAGRVAELSRGRTGASWQWQEAENLITTLATQRDNPQAQFGWVRWLQSRGRLDEAITYLTDMENTTTSDVVRQRARQQRALLALSTRPKDAATKQVLDDLQQGAPDLPSEIMAMLAMFMSGAQAKDVDAQLSSMVAKHQQNGLVHYWQGQVRQSGGQFAEAIQSYERALEFTAFRSSAQAGLYTCVQALIQSPKAGPEAAYKETSRLVAAHPNDPAVLMGHADTSRLMDDMEAMRASLDRLPKALEGSGWTPNAAVLTAGSVSAAEWLSAERPDQARRELEKTLRADPRHLSSLLAARVLAANAEDWPAVARYLDGIHQVQPDLWEIPLWEASLLYNQGKEDEARKKAADFLRKYPEVPMGYLALATFHEKAKDYAGALDWVRQWRKKAPDNLLGLSAELRLLARAGKAAEADALGEQFLAEQLKKAGQNYTEAEAKQPPRDEKEKQARAAYREQIFAAAELTGVLLISGGLQDGGALVASDAWLRRGVPLVEKLPEAVRKPNRILLKLLIGNSYLVRGREEKNKEKRAALIDQAIVEYQAIWDQAKGHKVAGNNLAWLLCREKDNPTAALNIIEEVRKGPVSQKPLGGERLDLEILDTMGVIYRAAGRSDDAVNLFKEALKRYEQEPRVLVHMGQSLHSAGRNNDQAAYQNFNLAIQTAEAKMKMTADPERKEKLQEVIAEARTEQKKIGLLPGGR